MPSLCDIYIKIVLFFIMQKVSEYTRCKCYEQCLTSHLHLPPLSLQFYSLYLKEIVTFYSVISSSCSFDSVLLVPFQLSIAGIYHWLPLKWCSPLERWTLTASTASHGQPLHKQPRQSPSLAPILSPITPLPTIITNPTLFYVLLLIAEAVSSPNQCSTTNTDLIFKLCKN